MPRFGSFRTAQYLFESRLRNPHLFQPKPRDLHIKESRMHRNKIISLKVLNKPAFAGILLGVFSTATVVGSHYLLLTTVEQRYEDIRRRLTELERHKQKVEEHWETMEIMGGVLENCVEICNEWKSQREERKSLDWTTLNNSVK
ncbi:hypothetical protein LTR99_005160 [Exophiala xenobiotica]|uniref:Uncharacterized protein n=1 Tax=Vermiconidia calcicola TaxID=1690605 RepID=A0AAV9Q8L0_9PEZI|nr:hypothetical protein LTR92_003916 [Exophiala xenobiotica]KAK5536082.1 hypothetical protein LTR25_005984 [Vermiconidia calcicola]KAK5541658.1 hypothetical protein LTR23_005747 [Chaetothyriales sp. CCFEE 6169]KAK5214211.1 hypothetical protein LTR41_000403 [Exophiala xenobiotica]KAK5227031.1 hypothetical protein LTR72_003021 [Exophiala xenobiotica]